MDNLLSYILKWEHLNTVLGTAVGLFALYHIGYAIGKFAFYLMH